MVAKQTGLSRKGRKRAPLDRAKLEELALSYLARFATTSAKLRDYLNRKIRERGIAEDAEPLDVDDLVARMVELRYIDDGVYARTRADGLLRKGYGGRRVEQALRAAGIEEDVRAEVAPGEVSAREAALAFARKRGFGPFGSLAGTAEPLERDRREKQIAAMVRAGHAFGTARRLVDAENTEEAEQWVEEAREWSE
jgi:regulatory protein